MNTLFRFPCLFLILSIASGMQASAQLPTEANETATALVGHRKDTQSEVKESTDIVIATFKTLGSSTGGDATGMVGYSRAQIVIFTTLKGALSGSINVNYSIISIGKDREAVPVIGVRYIMFIHKTDFHELELELKLSQTGTTEVVYDVEKLQPATDQAVAAIKTLIGGK